MKRIILGILVISSIFTFMLPGAVMAEYKKNKIAVLDFQQNGRFDTPDVGKIVAEWVITSLVETGMFDVIERRLLQQIVEEQKMGSSGLIDPNSASRLGKVLGVKTVVTGTVQSYDGMYEINARLISVESGSIITAEKVKASSATHLTELVSRIVAKIICNFPLQGYVVQRSPSGRVTIDLGRQAGVRTGMTFSVYTEGKVVKHPRTGEVLDVERDDQGVVRIDEVKDKTALGTIVRETCRDCIKSGNLVRGILAENEDEVVPPVKEERRREEKPRETRKVVEPTPVPVSDSNGSFRLVSGPKNDVKSVAFSEDGSLAASGDSDKSVMIWDTATWTPIATLTGHRGDVQAVNFSHDGRLLASGSADDTVILWNIANKASVATLKAGDAVYAVAFNPIDQLVASAGSSKNVLLWEVATGAKVRTLKGKDDVFSLAFSPDGRLLATAGKDKAVILWNAETGEEVRKLEGHKDEVRVVAFSPGGKLLASGGEDKTIILWEVALGGTQRSLTGHEDDIIALAISRDGYRLVSAEKDRIYVWDVKSNREVKRIKTEKSIEALAMSPDGRQVLIGSGKELFVYRLD